MNFSALNAQKQCWLIKKRIGFRVKKLIENYLTNTICIGTVEELL